MESHVRPSVSISPSPNSVAINWINWSKSISSASNGVMLSVALHHHPRRKVNSLDWYRRFYDISTPTPKKRATLLSLFLSINPNSLLGTLTLCIAVPVPRELRLCHRGLSIRLSVSFPLMAYNTSDINRLKNAQCTIRANQLSFAKIDSNAHWWHEASCL